MSAFYRGADPRIRKVIVQSSCLDNSEERFDPAVSLFSERFTNESMVQNNGGDVGG